MAHQLRTGTISHANRPLQAAVIAKQRYGVAPSRTIEENPLQHFPGSNNASLPRSNSRTLIPASDVTNAQVVADWWPFSREQRMASRPCWSLPELEALCGLLTAASGTSNDECCTTFRTYMRIPAQCRRQHRMTVCMSLPSELKRLL